MIRMKYFVYAVNYLLQSRFSVFSAQRNQTCLSTTISQLLLIGSMLSYDVAGQFGKNGIEGGQAAGARQVVYIHRRYPGSNTVPQDPPEGYSLFRRRYYGGFAVIFTPLIYGALLYPERNKARGLRFIIVGLICAALLWAGMQGYTGPSRPQPVLFWHTL